MRRLRALIVGTVSWQAISLLAATPAWADMGIPQGYLLSREGLAGVAAATVFTIACVCAGAALLRAARRRNLESKRDPDLHLG